VYDHKTWHSGTKKHEYRNAMQTRSKLGFTPLKLPAQKWCTKTAIPTPVFCHCKHHAPCFTSLFI